MLSAHSRAKFTISCHMSNTVCMHLCLSLVCHSITAKWHVCKTNCWVLWLEVFVLCLSQLASCASAVSGWEHGGKGWETNATCQGSSTLYCIHCFVVVFELLVDNISHYVVHYKIPTMHSKVQCTYNVPYILLLYTTMRCGHIFRRRSSS